MATLLPQRLAAILAADVAGYTVLMEQDESATVQAWRQARADVIDPTVALHHGRIVKLTGDGFLAEFATVESAMRAALAMQEAFRTLFAAEPPERQVAFRMGVNIGDVWVDSDDIYGAGVNIAARLQALADPGGICISEAVRDSVKHKIAARYEDMGLQHVKNVAEPVRAWHIRQADAASTISRDVQQSAPRRPAVSRGHAARDVPRWRRWQVAAAFVAVTLLAASSLTLWPGRTPSQYKLAVLPFVPVDESDQTLDLGILERLIAQLSRAPGLTVTPFSSVRRYAGIEQDPLAAGQKLGVRSVLATTFQRAREDLIHVSLLLYEVASGKALWTDEFDQRSDDPVAMQIAIAQRVANNLPSDIVGRLDARALKRATDIPKAGEFYFTGLGLAAERTPQSLSHAADYFRRAIELDPKFALAYAARANCYAIRAVFGAEEPTEAFRMAREDAEKALELDPNSAAANATMGHIHVQHDHDWAAGERRYKKAIELDPGYALTYMWLGMLYNYRGKFEDALKYMRKAEELEPDQQAYGANVGNALYHAHRFEEAIEQINRTLKIDENFDLALPWLGRAYLQSGDVEQAINTFERRRAEMLGKEADLVQAYAAAGQGDKARQQLDLMNKQVGRGIYVPAYDFAAAYMGLTDKEKALEYLEKAFHDGSQHLPHMPHDPVFDALHGNPEFEKLVRDLKL